MHRKTLLYLKSDELLAEKIIDEKKGDGVKFVASSTYNIR